MIYFYSLDNKTLLTMMVQLSILFFLLVGLSFLDIKSLTCQQKGFNKFNLFSIIVWVFCLIIYKSVVNKLFPFESQNLNRIAGVLLLLVMLLVQIFIIRPKFKGKTWKEVNQFTED